MLEKMKLSPEEKVDFAYAKPYASKHFVELMNLTDADKAILRKRVVDLTNPVEELLKDVTNAPNRIAQNYCIAIATAELVTMN